MQQQCTKYEKDSETRELALKQLSVSRVGARRRRQLAWMVRQVEASLGREAGRAFAFPRRAASKAFMAAPQKPAPAGAHPLLLYAALGAVRRAYGLALRAAGQNEIADDPAQVAALLAKYDRDGNAAPVSSRAGPSLRASGGTALSWKPREEGARVALVLCFPENVTEAGGIDLLELHFSCNPCNFEIPTL